MNLLHHMPHAGGCLQVCVLQDGWDAHFEGYVLRLE